MLDINELKKLGASDTQIKLLMSGNEDDNKIGWELIKGNVVLKTYVSGSWGYFEDIDFTMKIYQYYASNENRYKR